MIRVENITLSYQDGNRQLDAIKDLSLIIEDHQYVGILGPSGSGKSSLLYLLSGLRQPTSGEIYMDDRAYSRMSEKDHTLMRRTDFGFVFQQHFLINYMTALENVMVSARQQGAVQVERAKSLLAELGLGDKFHRYPHELSGGERQRVAIARATIHTPRIIFADEPTGLLDHYTSMEVVTLLRSVSKQGSLLTVTHNPEILDGADLVIHMRDGGIERIEDRVLQANADR